MSLSSISMRLLIGSGAVAAVLSAALVAGPGLATHVAADGTSSYPLFATDSTTTNGVVTLAPDASSTLVTVSLQRALPDASYAVTGCTIDPSSDAPNCASFGIARRRSRRSRRSNESRERHFDDRESS